MTATAKPIRVVLLDKAAARTIDAPPRIMLAGLLEGLLVSVALILAARKLNHR